MSFFPRAAVLVAVRSRRDRNDSEALPVRSKIILLGLTNFSRWARMFPDTLSAVGLRPILFPRQPETRATVASIAEDKGEPIAEPRELPFEGSVGYQLRMANRATQRYLQGKIEPHGVTTGMWYFLRALWQEDGLTQRELSRRIGTMEPTTLTALAAMEKAGFISRERDPQDRRKLHVLLTPKGRALEAALLPMAQEVVQQATAGFSPDDRARFLGYLAAVQRNLADVPDTPTETG